MALRNRKNKDNAIHFSIRSKLLTLVSVVATPFIILIVYLLLSMANYNNSYKEIVNNLTVANNYNLNFKEEMDESLYKLVVGYVSFDTISMDNTLKDPYDLIRDLRNDFTRLMRITTQQESKVWLQSLLRNISTLEDRIDDIKQVAGSGENYNENIKELDNNIYILTELIQDDIQYYIYYQTKSMEQITEDLNQQVQQFVIICSILIGVLVLIGGVVSVIMVSGIVKPVEELYRATKRVAAGDFSVRTQADTKDEIAVLSNGFNAMTENMQDLIDKIKEDEAKIRRTDLRLLQEQINPHFLYNTLDTIVWLIEGNEPDQAVQMVVTLSDFFRLVLSKGKEFITIREEEQHIGSYLQIQEMRYHDIMEYDIQIDKVLHQYAIPKLTLQPLVENSLYHGLKYKRAKGYIHINGEKEGNLIRLTVRDSGVGMEPEELKTLQREIEKPCQETEKGFGLANVNERLKMYFGQQYGITIQSTKGKGTIVEVLMPAISMEEVEQ